eukprot:CAMPEP_0198419326 /NCGR_PEP_ID=MMETSP1452-20131203/142_1 /TAXON_ID=1181717 /ORGANISM="Synchroma pusillum, Strain CCMP3072" /LENGTH=88 /DNA_ID=CAMNT_0044139451 /DNA_START=1 /DNA_END=263 /DNA_ORIENTATION=+
MTNTPYVPGTLGSNHVHVHEDDEDSVPATPTLALVELLDMYMPIPLVPLSIAALLIATQDVPTAVAVLAASAVLATAWGGMRTALVQR